VDGGNTSRVVYIGGMTRSGSTLTERLLGQLPGVCSIGELVYMWQRGIAEGNRCGCGEPFPRCPFWQQVLTTAFGGLEATDVARIAQLQAAVDRTRFIPALLAPSLLAAFRRRLAEYTAYCTRLYDGVRAVSGCEAVVDSSKTGSFAFCLRSSANIDLRVVHVVRDSRAVAHSWTRKVPRGERRGPSHMPTMAPARTAGQWSYQNVALELLASTGTPTLRVRYEDLVAAPKRTLAQIARFTGLEIGAHGLDFIGTDEDGYWADLGVSHTGSGNPMRFRTGRIRIRPDQEWRTGMRAKDRRTVTAITAPLLRHYGYLGSERRTGALAPGPHYGELAPECQS
jgi:hypothetical protein